MGKPLSMDLRERVIEAVEGGMSTRQAAARFSIRIAAAGSWARLKRAKGSVAPTRQGKPKGSVLNPHADFIRELIDTRPDITLQEIAERLARERSVKVVYTAVWKFLDRHGLTNKKDRPCQRTRARGREDRSPGLVRWPD